MRKVQSYLKGRKLEKRFYKNNKKVILKIYLNNKFYTMKIFIRIIAFFIVIWLWLYFYKPELFIKDNYDIDTINIKKYIITPNPSKLYLLNLKLSSTNNYNLNSLWWTVQLYFDSINIFQTNIIELLENSSNRKTTLNVYIQQLKYNNRKLETAISIIENNVEDESSKYQEFLSQKQQWDQEFWEWFIVKDSQLSVKWFDASLKNWPLATEHRIIKNASLIVLNKLKKIKYLTDTKLAILEENNNTIVTNFDVIKWNLLQKLQKLKYQLETNRYTD